MSSRLFKKVVKQQEEEDRLHAQEQDNDSESPDSAPPSINPFDLLNDDDDDQVTLLKPSIFSFAISKLAS